MPESRVFLSSAREDADTAFAMLSLRKISIFLFASLAINTILLERGDAISASCAESYELLLKALRTKQAGPLQKIPNSVFLQRVALKEDQREIIARIARRYGVANLQNKDWVGVINEVYDAVSKIPGKSGLEKGEMLAAFVAELDFPIIKKMALDDRKTINYAFSLAVNRLEAFAPHEYRIVAAAEMPFKVGQGDTASLGNYLNLTNNYLDGKYKQLNYFGIFVLGPDEIRTMEVHNLFPLQIAHDMRHVHYGTGHPRALAAFFSTARSKNISRYALLAAAFEGVDTVQYRGETALIRYLSEKRGMDIEEGMTFLARATQSELQRIIAECGDAGYFEATIKAKKNWVPSTTSLEQVANLDQEIDNMVNNFANYQTSPDPEVRNALIYSNTPSRPNQGIIRRFINRLRNGGDYVNHEEKNF